MSDKIEKGMIYFYRGENYAFVVLSDYGVVF